MNIEYFNVLNIKELHFKIILVEILPEISYQRDSFQNVKTLTHSQPHKLLQKCHPEINTEKNMLMMIYKNSISCPPTPPPLPNQ